MRIFFTIILLILFAIPGLSQDEAWLYRMNHYNFIRYDLNELHHFGDDAYSQKFYKKLELLVREGEGIVNVVQIGGSHIQAGILSGQIRNRLQQFNGEMNAGWGFMFSYRMSRTNSPFGYYIRYTGYWQTCRNVDRRRTSELGVGGIAATTSSSKASLTILLEKENELDYSFNKVRLFYNSQGAEFSVSSDDLAVEKVDRKDNFIDFELTRRVDSLKITIRKENDSAGRFTLFGLATESAPNGIVFNSIGVNGAHVPAFNNCELFEEQLALLKPDLVILDLGINDAYGRHFSQRAFENHYSELIEHIRRAAPETAIIFTTNNDSYLYRRYVNKNGEKVQQSMFKMAEEFDTGVWDMYTVMGGLNSVVLWEKNGLARRDKVHFTREGYLILGDLFVNALLQNFEDYLQHEKELTQINR